LEARQGFSLLAGEQDARQTLPRLVDEQLELVAVGEALQLQLRAVVAEYVDNGQRVLVVFHIGSVAPCHGRVNTARKIFLPLDKRKNAPHATRGGQKIARQRDFLLSPSGVQNNSIAANSKECP